LDVTQDVLCDTYRQPEFAQGGVHGMGGIVVWIQRHYKRLLALLGISSLFELVQEHFRIKMMEWAVSHLGSVGRWLMASPFSILTIVVAGILVVLLRVVILQSVPAESPVVDHAGRRIVRARFTRSWILGCAVVILLVAFAIAYGGYSYSRRTRTILTIADVKLRADASNTFAEITVLNEGKSVLFRDSVIQSAIVAAPHYASAEEENKFVQCRSEMGSCFSSSAAGLCRYGHAHPDETRCAFRTIE
jgi:hypothetical protein